jgi:dihydroflavonol-4-reductase
MELLDEASISRAVQGC